MYLGPELRGSAGPKYIYLSDARGSEPLPTDPVAQLLGAATKDIDGEVVESVQTFLRRALADALRYSHGALVAVCPPGGIPGIFGDCVALSPSFDIALEVREYLRDRGEESIAKLLFVSRLLKGMVGADGITVIASDGCLLGYNAFVSSAVAGAESPAGGARRRAFETLCSHVGGQLSAAYYQSQDGNAEYKGS